MAPAPLDHGPGHLPPHQEAPIGRHLPDLAIDLGRGVAHVKAHIGPDVEHRHLDGGHVPLDFRHQGDRRLLLPGVDAEGPGLAPLGADAGAQGLELVQVAGTAGDAGHVSVGGKAAGDGTTQIIPCADHKAGRPVRHPLAPSARPASYDE